MRRWRGFMQVTFVVGVTAGATFAGALATNVFSAQSRWPGPLDLLRQHPSWGLLIAFIMALIAGYLSYLWRENVSEPASRDDVEQLGATFKQDIADAVGSASPDDDRVTSLPPNARALIDSAGSQRLAIVQVVAVFGDPAEDPWELARQWVVSPPAAVTALPATGLLVVAEIFMAYGQYEAGSGYIERAVDCGAANRVFWLTRAAATYLREHEENTEAADRCLGQAAKLLPGYPFLVAVQALQSHRWREAEEQLRKWCPSDSLEIQMRLSALAVALGNQDKLDNAIDVLNSEVGGLGNAGLMLQAARLFQLRSVRASGDSRWSDAYRAVELALGARHLRRQWRGDSAEAVAVAAEAAINADDGVQAWVITQPEPDGHATPQEAKDPRVLAVAAISAALTQRLDQAQRLLEHAPEGYIRMYLHAEILSAQCTDHGSVQVIDAWKNAYQAASSDEERLQALRALALEGFRDDQALESLRPSYSKTVEEIETIADILSVSGSDADHVLRRLEDRTHLASVRRAELIRHQDPDKAAQILSDAFQRWGQPRLLLHAVDCFIDAGKWPQAEAHANTAIAVTSGLWAGRATLLRRLATAQTHLSHWGSLITTCRSLLEIDALDDEARWLMAWAQEGSGSPESAWQTLNRPNVAIEASMPVRAKFLLYLMRRYAAAERLTHTALAIIRAFSDDEEVWAAALTAVGMRADTTELSEDLGQDVTNAWISFHERFPESTTLHAYSIQDGSDPIPALTEQLRNHAQAQEQVLETIDKQLMPLGLLSSTVGKPYAALFPFKPLGVHRVVTPSEIDFGIELQYALLALEQACLIDTSALYTLTLTPDIGDILFSLLDRPSILADSVQDLVGARELLSIPQIVGTMYYDRDLQRTILSEDQPEVRSKHRESIQQMLRTAMRCRQISHSSKTHIPAHDFPLEPVWLKTLDAAIDSAALLLCDDVGLRRLAHAAGVRAFSTVTLQAAASQQGHLSHANEQQAKRQLIHNDVVDLPISEADLTVVANEQHWQPRSVARVLARGASWSDFEKSLAVFRTAFRHTSPENLAAWAHAALTGLDNAVPTNDKTAVLGGLTTNIMLEHWIKPEHATAWVNALEQVTPSKAHSITTTALNNAWQQLVSRHARDEALFVYLHLISKLDDTYRYHAVHHVIRINLAEIPNPLPAKRQTCRNLQRVRRSPSPSALLTGPAVWPVNRRQTPAPSKRSKHPALHGIQQTRHVTEALDSSLYLPDSYAATSWSTPG